MRIDCERHITKNGVVKTNPGVIPKELLLSIGRAWEDIKAGRVTHVRRNTNR